jgi:hypothetical protein
VITLAQLDFVVVELTFDADQPGGAARDAADLGAGLRWLG